MPAADSMTVRRDASPWVRGLRQAAAGSGTRLALGVLALCALVALYAPWLCGDTALLWWDHAGLRLPILSHLLSAHHQRIDELVFNIIGALLPLLLLAQVLLGRWPRLRRHLRWAMPLLALVVCLVPLGGRALYRDRPDRAETWAAWRALPEQQRPLAIFPLLTTRPNRPYPAAVLLPPGSMLDDGSRAWLGTDIDTEDVLANLVHGVRVSLTIGFLATALSIAIGTMVGAASGYLGGRMDMLLQRVVEIMLCFPTFILVLAVVAALGPSLINIVLVIGLTGWADTARLVRGEFLAQMGREYVLAARALGYGGVRIALRHILPNTAGPLLVSATFGVAGAVFLESGLAFLGLADPTVASWGAILEQGRRQPGYLWLILTPGIAIFVLVLSLNTVGDSLRAALGGRRR